MVWQLKILQVQPQASVRTQINPFFLFIRIWLGEVPTLTLLAMREICPRLEVTYQTYLVQTVSL